MLPRPFQWDAVEDKGTVATYAVGAVVAVWLSGTVVNAISAVPLVSVIKEYSSIFLLINICVVVTLWLNGTVVNAISAVPLVGV